MLNRNNTNNIIRHVDITSNCIMSDYVIIAKCENNKSVNIGTVTHVNTDKLNSDKIGQSPGGLTDKIGQNEKYIYTKYV